MFLISELMMAKILKYFYLNQLKQTIVKIILIIMNNAAVIAVSLDNKLADPLADIIPPIPLPPPKPKPSLSLP